MVISFFRVDEYLTKAKYSEEEREKCVYASCNSSIIKYWVLAVTDILTERFCLFAHRLMRVQELFRLETGICKLGHQELNIFVTFSHYCMKNSDSAAGKLKILALPTAD